MKAIIIGAGEIGFHLAKVLVYEGHDVVLIDKSPKACSRCNESLDLLTLQGSGASPALLKEAGIDSTELLLAVSHNDEINMLACHIANKHGVKTKVAQVSSHDYFAEKEIFTPQDVGIDLLIDPERLSAGEFLRLLKTPETRELVEFEGGKIQLAAFRVKTRNPMIGKSIKNLSNNSLLNDLQFTAIKRKNGNTIIPDGSDYIREGDEVFAIGGREAISQLFKKCKISHTREVKRVIIVGAEPIGIYLAQQLEAKGIKVKLLEPDEQRANFASTVLSGKITVSHGDYLQKSFLDEAGISSADSFISVTGDDENDVMACVTAKQYGAKHTMALIQKPRYLPILSAIPAVDAVVSRHLTAVSNILHLVHSGKVISAASLHEIDAEVLELAIPEKSKVCGKKIQLLKFPKNAMIGAIMRSGEVLIPTGDLRLEAEDRVIIFSEPSVVPNVEKMFL